MFTPARLALQLFAIERSEALVRSIHSHLSLRPRWRATIGTGASLEPNSAEALGLNMNHPLDLGDVPKTSRSVRTRTIARADLTRRCKTSKRAWPLLRCAKLICLLLFLNCWSGEALVSHDLMYQALNRSSSGTSQEFRTKILGDASAFLVLFASINYPVSTYKLPVLTLYQYQ